MRVERAAPCRRRGARQSPGEHEREPPSSSPSPQCEGRSRAMSLDVAHALTRGIAESQGELFRLFTGASLCVLLRYCLECPLVGLSVKSRAFATRGGISRLCRRSNVSKATSGISECLKDHCPGSLAMRSWARASRRAALEIASAHYVSTTRPESYGRSRPMLQGGSRRGSSRSSRARMGADRVGDVDIHAGEECRASTRASDPSSRSA